MSPLYDATSPLLRVAPLGMYLFDRELVSDVLVYRHEIGIWMSVSAVSFAYRNDSYRVVEWSGTGLHDHIDTQFFPSMWELLTWLSVRFSKVPSSSNSSYACREVLLTA